MAQEEKLYENNLKQVLEEGKDSKNVLDQKIRFETDLKITANDFEELQEKHQRLIKEKDDKILKFIEDKANMIKTQKEMELELIDIQKQIQNANQSKIQEENELKLNFQKNLEKHNEAIQALQTQIDEDNLFMEKKYQLSEEHAEVNNQLIFQKQENIRVAEVKQQEKITQTDEIKKNMLKQIQETKKNLLSQKKDEFQTQTRMAMLLNNQLNSELDYQSKHTEKISIKNYQLEQTIKQLQKEVEVHKHIQFEFQVKIMNSQKETDKLEYSIKHYTKKIDKNEQKVQLPEINNKSNQKQIDQLKLINNNLKNDIQILREQIQNQKKKKLQKETNCSLSMFIYDKLYQLQQFAKGQTHLANTNNLLEKLQNENMIHDTLAQQEKDALINIVFSQIKPYLNKEILTTRDNSIQLEFTDQYDKTERKYIQSKQTSVGDLMSKKSCTQFERSTNTTFALNYKK